MVSIIDIKERGKKKERKQNRKALILGSEFVYSLEMKVSIWKSFWNEPTSTLKTEQTPFEKGKNYLYVQPLTNNEKALGRTCEVKIQQSTRRM